MNFFESLWDQIIKTLFTEERWRFYLEGFSNSVQMTLMACLIGVSIGVLVAIVKVHHLTTGKLRVLSTLANVYTTVIRGTPVMLQLLIFYYIIFSSAPASAKVFIAALAFGVNSGAYVSEIIRAGILSVDVGQTEAGRSLGLSSGKTMRLIVLPQAVRNILPALFNEVIALLKETSVAGYITIVDITRAGDLIRSRTFQFMPLLVSAAIYLVLVLALTKLQSLLEKRMANRD